MLIHATSFHPIQPNTSQAVQKEAAKGPVDSLQAQTDALPAMDADFHAMGQEFRFKRGRFRSEETKQAQSQELSSSFPNRDGYDKNFLGRTLELPQLDPSIKSQAATLIGKPDEIELKYTNFSIVMNKERRQAFFATVNIDGAKIEDHSRRGIKWTTDSRIPREHQLGNEAYRNNPIDRGHMVRRRDPVWGPHAKRANEDSFSYTNAGLQHGSLNQKSWLDLENHILNQAKEKDEKYTVITGPVFAADDPDFNNNGRMKTTQIPREFWKVVVWNDPKEGLQGAGFIQSQKNYVRGNKLFKSDSDGFDAGRMGLYQIPIDQLEEMTKLNFGEMNDTSPEARRIEDSSEVNLF